MPRRRGKLWTLRQLWSSGPATHRRSRRRWAALSIFSDGRGTFRFAPLSFPPRVRLGFEHSERARSLVRSSRPRVFCAADRGFWWRSPRRCRGPARDVRTSFYYTQLYTPHNILHRLVSENLNDTEERVDEEGALGGREVGADGPESH